MGNVLYVKIIKKNTNKQVYNQVPAQSVRGVLRRRGAEVRRALRRVRGRAQRAARAGAAPAPRLVRAAALRRARRAPGRVRPLRGGAAGTEKVIAFSYLFISHCISYHHYI